MRYAVFAVFAVVAMLSLGCGKRSPEQYMAARPGPLPASLGGTGLEAPGDAGFVLTSTGTAWASAPSTGGGGGSAAANGPDTYCDAGYCINVQSSGDGGPNALGSVGEYLILDDCVTTGSGTNGPVHSCTQQSSGFTNDAGTAWVTIAGPYAPEANSYTVVQAEAVLADYSGDAGFTAQQNFVDCSVKFVAIAQAGGGLQFVPGYGSSAMTTGASPVLSLVPFGCTSQTGCTTSGGDAGCATGSTAGAVTFQAATSDGGLILQAEGVYEWKSTTAWQATRRKQGTP